MTTKRVQLTRPAYQGTAFVKRAVQQTAGSHVHTSTHEEHLSRGNKGGPHTLLRRGCGDTPFVSHTAEELNQVEELQKAARTLTAEQRKQLLDLLAFDVTQQTTSLADRELVMWSGCVADAMQRVTTVSYGPQLVRRALASRPAWMPVQELMKASKLAENSVNERQSIYTLLAGILVEHANYVAKKSGAPLSAKLVANCAPQLAALFDQQFPGYLAAGLVPVVVKRLTGSRMQ